MKKIVSFLGLGILVIAPAFTFAQTQTNVDSLLGKVATWVGLIVPILITVGVAYLIYGIIKYITAKSDDKKKEGRSTIIYGVIGMFVIVSIWGIIAILQNTLGIQGSGNTQCVPCVEGTLNCQNGCFHQ